MPASGRALLIGSSYSAAPIFFALKRRGLHVTVCGAVRDDPCHAYADASCFLDYSDQEALLDYVAGGDFEFLVPSCNDFAYISGSYVASRLGRFVGFDAHDTTLMLHAKHRFRAFCEAIDLPAPRVLFRGDPQDRPAGSDFPLPVLVKPAESFSGRGVTKVEHAAQLDTAVAAASAASRGGAVVIEAFVEGSLHSHSAFVEDGRIFWDTFVDEFCVEYPYQVDCSYSPSQLPAAVREGVRAAMAELIARANLADGLLHTQFIAQGARFAIVECMRRGPGDLYGQLVEEAVGAPHYDMYACKFLGEAYRRPKAERGKFVGRHTISVAARIGAAGAFRLRGLDAPLTIVPIKRSAEPLDAAPFDKLAIVFAEFASAEHMVRATPRFRDYVDIVRLEDRYGFS